MKKIVHIKKIDYVFNAAKFVLPDILSHPLQRSIALLKALPPLFQKRGEIRE